MKTPKMSGFLLNFLTFLQQKALDRHMQKFPKGKTHFCYTPLLI